MGRIRSVLEKAETTSMGGLDLLAGGLDEAGIPLTDEDLAEQLLLLLFAGYETTASSLSCLVLSLLQNPTDLNWLLEELVNLAWPPIEGNEAIEYDAQRAPRLDAVIKEVMRITP